MAWDFIQKRIKKTKNNDWPYGPEQIKCEVCGEIYHISNGPCPFCVHAKEEKQKELDYQNYLKEQEFKERMEREKEESERESEEQNPHYYFEQIIESIKTQFIPQRITDEEHLQSQLTIFLQAKYPERRIIREAPTRHGDKVDILIDDRYAFEIKVPQNRTTLRNLKAQLEEYQEEYPMICAVIFNDQALNMSANIEEFVAKYKDKLKIPTIVLSGNKRG